MADLKIWSELMSNLLKAKKSWIWNFPTEECRTFVWGTVFYATYNESKSGNFWSSWPSFWNGFRWMWQWQNEHLWQLQRLIPSRAIFFISSSIPSRCLKYSWGSWRHLKTQKFLEKIPIFNKKKTENFTWKEFENNDYPHVDFLVFAFCLLDQLLMLLIFLQLKVHFESVNLQIRPKSTSKMISNFM